MDPRTLTGAKRQAWPRARRPGGQGHAGHSAGGGFLTKSAKAADGRRSPGAAGGDAPTGTPRPHSPARARDIPDPRRTEAAASPGPEASAQKRREAREADADSGGAGGRVNGNRGPHTPGGCPGPRTASPRQGRASTATSHDDVGPKYCSRLHAPREPTTAPASALR